MPQPPLIKIDESNRNAHYYLGEEHECFFFHEYAAGKGYAHSAGNQLVHNLKKLVSLRGQPQYRYKGQAIETCAGMLRDAFGRAAWVFGDATFVPIPPSKQTGHPEHDDRMTQVILKACQGKNADVRELLRQNQNTDAAHMQAAGFRPKPHDLAAMYEVVGYPSKSTVILVDDVLTTGAHFVAAHDVIRAAYPDTRILGMFIARRVLANPFEDEQAM